MSDPLDVRDHWARMIRHAIFEAKKAGVSIQFCNNDDHSVDLVAYDHPESSFGIVIYEESEEND
jgi:hypothetical protein